MNKHTHMIALRASALALVALMLIGVAVLTLRSIKMAQDRDAKALAKYNEMASAKLATELKVTISQVSRSNQVPWRSSQSILGVTCENLSSKRLTLTYNRYSREHGRARELSFRGYDSKGMQVPMTAYGKMLQQPESHSIFGGESEGWGGPSIDPHGSATYYVDLNRLIDVSKPGVYTVTATFTPANPALPGSVTSNTIQVEIDGDGMTM